MENFSFCTPTKVIFGKGCVDQLHDELVAIGKKVLLVYGGNSIKRSGLYDRVKKDLIDCEIYEQAGVVPNPRVTSVRAGADQCKEHGIEVVLAVGGGSVLDCAKAIAAAACYDGDPWDLVLDHTKVKKALPVVTVLTLAATGSEFNQAAVISNLETNEKIGLIDPHIYPRISFLDPELTFSVPANQTAAGSADIMSHILEQYFCADSSIIADGICETILRTIIACAPRAIANGSDYDARSQLMWASSLACNGICSLGNSIRPWPCHGMEHELSAYYDITHGVGLAILTPHLMRYSLNEQTVERFCQYGKNVFGLTDEADRMAMANKAIDKTAEFFVSLGIPNTLSELGIDDSKFDVMAKHAIERKPLFAKFFRPLDAEDIKAIYRMSL